MTESEANGGNSLSVPRHINIGNSLEDPTPMAFGPGFDEIIFDGGASITYPNDTYISSLTPTTNYGSATEAFVNNENFLFISYPMPYIPEYATIVEATLNIAYRYKSDQSASVSAYRVSVNWNESSLTWNSLQPSYDMGINPTVLSTTIISDTQGSSLSTPRFTQIDISDAAAIWHSGEAQNYGVALKTLGETVRFTVNGDVFTLRR